MSRRGPAFGRPSGHARGGGRWDGAGSYLSDSCRGAGRAARPGRDLDNGIRIGDLVGHRRVTGRPNPARATARAGVAVRTATSWDTAQAVVEASRAT
jgi:hypothetical protein